MTDFGVTPEGFRRPTLQEILEQYQDLAREIIGPVNFGPESAIGQQISIQAEREDRAWAALESVYLSQYPNTASGRSLDNAVQLTGITRLPATRTIGQAALIGIPGTAIPLGTQASVASTNAIFELVNTTIINPLSALQAFIAVIDVQPETDYTVIVNGTPYTYQSSVSPNVNQIIDGLVSQMPSEIVSASNVTTPAQGLFLITANFVSSFSVITSSNLQTQQVGTPAQMRALETGPTLALAGTLNAIVNPVVGWQAIINYTDFPVGRNQETNSELRFRRQQSLQVVGSSTVEAIRSRLIQNVTDVLAVSIVENRLDVVDGDGRPPHSYEAVVSGGVDAEVAQEIWQTKPAGIETHGDVEVIVSDSQGGSHPIRFSRPIDRYVWVNVEIDLNGVGTYPEGGENIIKENIVAYGQSLGVSDNILIQALFGPVYQVPGINNATIEIATSAAPNIYPSGEFDDVNISIGSTEISVWAVERIEVTVND